MTRDEHEAEWREAHAAYTAAHAAYLAAAAEPPPETPAEYATLFVKQNKVLAAALAASAAADRVAAVVARTPEGLFREVDPTPFLSPRPPVMDLVPDFRPFIRTLRGRRDPG